MEFGNRIIIQDHISDSVTIWYAAYGHFYSSLFGDNKLINYGDMKT